MVAGDSSSEEDKSIRTKFSVCSLADVDVVTGNAAAGGGGGANVHDGS